MVDQVRAERGPRIQAGAGFLQHGQGCAADFLNRGFQRALKLLVADDGGVLLRQRLALAARDLKKRIARHAEFLFDDRGGVRAHEPEEVAADVCLGFHAAGRVHNDIGNRPHECAQKINLRALPDSRRAGLGQNDPQRDTAFEPALAVARPHDGGDQHGDNDEHERAGDFVDAPEFEALFHQLASVHRGVKVQDVASFCSWSQVSQQRHHGGDDKQSGDGAGERPLRGLRDFRDRPADTQPANATGRAGKQGGQDAFGEDVENVFGLNRARHGVRKQKQITDCLSPSRPRTDNRSQRRRG